MKKYIKNGEIKTREEITVKTILQEEIDGELKDVEYITYNPSDKMIIADGWEVYDNRAEQYEERVVELVREKYSINQELAILRQRDSKPEEFAEYDSYVEGCKARAREEIYES